MLRTQQGAREEPLRTGGESAPARTRVVLIEDHAILRAGIRTLLDTEGDLEVVGEAGTANEGIRVVQETSAMLAVMDLSLPGGSGLSAIDALRAASPNLRVLILTAYCTDEYLRAAFSAGADGYLLKDATRAELMQAIRAVMAGKKYFSAPVSARLLSGYLGTHATTPASPRAGITAREREVLTRIALGDSNKRAALAMRLSIKTVEKHRANLMRKLALHNTAGMTLFAIRNGLLPNAATDAGVSGDRPGR